MKMAEVPRRGRSKRGMPSDTVSPPAGVQDSVVDAGTNEPVIPNYKWGNIREIADALEGLRHLTFKSRELQRRLTARRAEANGHGGPSPSPQS